MTSKDQGKGKGKFPGQVKGNGGKSGSLPVQAEEACPDDIVSKACAEERLKQIDLFVSSSIEAGKKLQREFDSAEEAEKESCDRVGEESELFEKRKEIIATLLKQHADIQNEMGSLSQKLAEAQGVCTARVQRIAGTRAYLCSRHSLSCKLSL